ncbi:MAG: carboxypeptidase regulatory-like domain-containing protein [Methanobrevibacter sp.]|nr:carboxypeptidase regulatory-like domain-containing protein [Methanobrevibacter sp.]
MDYNKIIIALVIVLIALVVVGVLLLNPLMAKEDVNLAITSDSSLYDGDNIVIFLSAINGTPIANEVVNVTIIDANGGKNPQVVTTDENGNGILQLNGLTPGNYNVNVSYGGNSHYKSNSTIQNLEMNEVKTVETSSQTSSSGSSTPYDINNLPPSNDPYPETRRYYIDQYHVRQEYADDYHSIVDIRTGERHGGFGN